MGFKIYFINRTLLHFACQKEEETRKYLFYIFNKDEVLKKVLLISKSFFNDKYNYSSRKSNRLKLVKYLVELNKINLLERDNIKFFLFIEFQKKYSWNCN